MVAIDAGEHRVVVGPQSALACHEVTLFEVSWVAGRGALAGGAKVLARLRSTAPALPATLLSVADDAATLHLDEPQFGIATGQAAVLYNVTDSDVVLGGGWINAAPTIGIA